MAVVEIAKIQVRRGIENQTGVPQLAGGEFAWAADTEHLYIGLNRVDGGSRDTNIRVLTENDVKSLFNIVTTGLLNTVTNYVWESDSAATITTSTSINNAYYQQVQRSVQNKLDDMVNVADFGVYPSTNASPVDCSAALQMVIDHLYLDTDSLSTSTHWDASGTLKYNKKLRFGPGCYKVGQTILLPRKAVLMGEGIDKTIIESITTGSGIFQTVDYVGRRSNPLNWGKFDPTTDSASTNITGVGQPNSIQIENMTIRYSTSTGLAPHLSLISLDCVSGGSIRNVKLQGRQASWLVVDGNVPTGIDLRGYNALTTENILIDNCEFNGLYYGVKSNYDTNHVVIQNNNFIASSYGIALSTATNLLATIGPNYFRATNNKFQSIEHQAIYIGMNTIKESHNFISENNSFINVGNTNGGTENVAVEPVIIYNTDGNASINDYFERQRFHNKNFSTSTVYYPLVQGKAKLDFKAISTASITTSSFVGGIIGTTSTGLIRLPITSNFQVIDLKYAVVGNNTPVPATKVGTLTVNVRPGNPPVSVTLTDNYDVIGAEANLLRFAIAANNTTRALDLGIVSVSTTTKFTIEYSVIVTL